MPDATSDAAREGAARKESRWPVTLTIFAVVVAQLLLARDLSIEPSWLLPAIQTAILVVLLLANPTQQIQQRPKLSHLHLLLAGVLSLATIVTLSQLVDALIHGSNLPPARLLADALAVWLSSAVAFSLWYWVLDAGGPSARSFASAARAPAFLFPQQLTPGLIPGWRPTYGDYLYLSFTNQTAFSPTDTMPLALWSKALMAVQAILSLAVAALVVSRAVNIMAS